MILVPRPLTLAGDVSELIELCVLVIGLPIAGWRASRHLRKIHERLEKIHDTLERLDLSS